MHYEMTSCPRTVDQRGKGCSAYRAYVHEGPKARATIVMDLSSCYACHRLMRSAFGDGAPDVMARVAESRELFLGRRDCEGTLSLEERHIIDEIYEDVLAVTEFYMNRLTPDSDRNISDVMDGVRFACCHRLDIHDPDSAARCTKIRKSQKNKGAGYNSALFGYDDIHNIPFMDVRKDDRIPDLPADYGSLYRIFDDRFRIGENLAVSEASVSGLPGGIAVRVPAAISRNEEMPFMELVSGIMDVCRSHPPFDFQVNADLTNMRADRLCPGAPFLGMVGKRDDDLDNTHEKRLGDLMARLDALDPDAARDIAMFFRIADCILMGSGVEEVPGRRKHMNVTPRLDPLMLLTMMDDEMFGGMVHLSDILFVDAPGMAESYVDYLKHLGFRFQGGVHGSCELVSEDLRRFYGEWRYSGRSRGEHSTGAMLRIDSVSSCAMAGCGDRIRRSDRPLILVTHRPDRRQLIAITDGFKIKAERSRVKALVVIDPDTGRGGYSCIDDRSADYIEFGVRNMHGLFGIHSNGSFERTALALDDMAEAVAASSDAGCRTDLGEKLLEMALDAFKDYHKDMLAILENVPDN